jgi:hypothetical protein
MEHTPKNMSPWLLLEHPAKNPTYKWWLTSTTPASLNVRSVEEVLKVPGVQAVVIMHDCSSQGREYRRCFAWIANKRYMDIFPADKSKIEGAVSLFGDDYFWVITPSGSPS